MQRRHTQRGAVLVVSLLILVVLTLLAVTAINTSTVNLRIVDNMRARMQAEDATQQAIEQVMSSIGNFNSPTATTININDPYISDDYQVNVAAPDCIAAQPATGYSAKWGLAPEDTTWVLDADVTGPDDASARIVQGVRIRMVADSCPGA